VTNADIADLLKEKGFEIDRRKILLADPIKTLGENAVPVKLHRDVTAQIRVTVKKAE
jgi:large subunit ribosomal protein L9